MCVYLVSVVRTVWKPRISIWIILKILLVLSFRLLSLEPRRFDLQSIFFSSLLCKVSFFQVCLWLRLRHWKNYIAVVFFVLNYSIAFSVFFQSSMRQDDISEVFTLLFWVLLLDNREFVPLVLSIFIRRVSNKAYDGCLVPQRSLGCFVLA